MATAQRQGGFVLVVVLALLVVLSLLAAGVATASRSAVEETRADQENFAAALDAVSTRETVLFLLASQRTTLGGLTVDGSGRGMPAGLDDDDPEGTSVAPIGNEIRLDGTPYRGVGDAMFALQDSRGQLNPNWSANGLRHAFYRFLGATPDQWPGLDAKRLDYQDPDDLHRLDGAEADAYRTADLPPPPNRPVATPLEFRRILGWNTRLEHISDTQLMSMLTTDRTAVLNVNTAPAAVLALLPGMDETLAERMVQLRSRQPYLSLGTVQQLFPIFMEGDDDALTLFSNTAGNLTLWHALRGSRTSVHWTLTPYDQHGRPWRIEYEVTLPRGKQPDPGVVKPPETPLFSPKDSGRG